MKKVISLLMAVIMVLTVPVTAFAASLDGSEPVYGVLMSEDGEQILIEGRVCDTMQTRAGDAGSVTYEFAIPASVASSDSTTIDSPDSGYASHVYLTISYAMRNTPTEYKLTGVSGRWTIEDPNVAVLSTSLTYGCSGLFPSIVTQTNTVNNVSNPFSISTGFSSYVVEDYGVMGANLTLNYLMGSSRKWSFTLQNNLFNN